MLPKQVRRVSMVGDVVDHLDGLGGYAQQRVQVGVGATVLIQ